MMLSGKHIDWFSFPKFWVLGGTLIFSILAGGWLGYAVQAFWGAQYRASVRVPFNGDVSFFRNVEPNLRSQDRFKAFAIALKPDRTPELDQLYQRALLHGETRLFKFAHVGPRLVVTTEGSTPEFAAQFVQLGVEFLRHTLVLTALVEVIEKWRTGASVDRARVTDQIVNQKMAVASISRRIAAMEQVRDKYRDNTHSAPFSGSVQVNIFNALDFLRTHRLIGLESQLIDARDQISLLEERLTHLGTLEKFTTDHYDLRKAETNPVSAVEEMISQIRQLQAAPSQSPKDLPVDKALAEINFKLTELRSNFIDALILPQAPLVQRGRLAGSSAFLAGLLLGFIIWAASLYIFLMLRPQRPAVADEGK